MDGLEQIYEPGRQIPVCARTDVVVAGGGVSGCAAALAARRAGSQVILLERNGILGGVATAGLMANIGNHFLDNAGQPVSGGIPLEIVNRLVAIGGASDQWCSREVPGVVVDSERLRYLLGKMLQEEGVTVLTHAPAVRPIVDSGDARGVFIETKTGRGAILAAVVVDATGEADLAFRAGCPMRWEDGTASLEFKMGGANLEALYQHFRNQPETFPVGMDMVKGFTEFERNWVERGIFFFPHGGGRVWDIFQHAIV
mgnify:CR=1 FL=1